MAEYIISIDQSTQGTKALLFDQQGLCRNRTDVAHAQIIDKNGWVSHNPNEIYCNTITAVKKLLDSSGIQQQEIAGIGISNQRETSLAWDRRTGQPVCNAVVWHCARAADLCTQIGKVGSSEQILQKTGLPLSPYFPAAKIAWILQHIEGAKQKAKQGNLCCGTIDSWLLYKLTNGKSFKTDYSNASRTQLFHLRKLAWDSDLCRIFGIFPSCLAEICDSDACFGMTNLEGMLDHPVPIHSILGDSHAALFGQGCRSPGMIKATYGTGSSVMMNLGTTPIQSSHGLASSLAWRMHGTVNYVLEGNINYTGAVISWLKHDVQLICSAEETEHLAEQAEQNDNLYFVPAFTGLGAPYWNSHAQAALLGITRTTGRNEIVRAGLECIAYQVADVVNAMVQDSKIDLHTLRVDGGPTRNRYLMQFQSDILSAEVQVPKTEELSAVGAAYAAGLALDVYSETVFDTIQRKNYCPQMPLDMQRKKQNGWKAAAGTILSQT